MMDIINDLNDAGKVHAARVIGMELEYITEHAAKDKAAALEKILSAALELVNDKSIVNGYNDIDLLTALRRCIKPTDSIKVITFKRS